MRQGPNRQRSLAQQAASRSRPREPSRPPLYPAEIQQQRMVTGTRRHPRSGRGQQLAPWRKRVAPHRLPCIHIYVCKAVCAVPRVFSTALAADPSPTLDASLCLSPSVAAGFLLDTGADGTALGGGFCWRLAGRGSAAGWGPAASGGKARGTICWSCVAPLGYGSPRVGNVRNANPMRPPTIRVLAA